MAFAGVVAAAQGGARNCVLPVVDPIPPVLPGAVPPPPVPPPPLPPIIGAGFGFSPLLLGLAGIAAAGLLYLLLHKNNDEKSPS